MKLRDFLIGVATGVAAAYVLKEASTRVNPNRNPNSVLEDIKNQFKQEGPIDGSWIYMQPETFKKENISIPVYKGGISRVEDGEQVNFEFAADAKSGAIVDLVRV
ncbi:peptidase M4 [Kurthia sp. 3B1D]|uniref:Peptidase M4 n=2 Tax=Kurthia TaxID=1649 RepID=A0A433RYL5_9BACL|nr:MULTISPECIES: hypothetical protein [unclassified Kurthia]RUS58373.1 peptidase M4 [Kurthia sp. 3B1D]HIX43763.1 hypothetical protein [Candidatus Kurthia intestinigallinarum]